MTFSIELDREDDGRWLAEVPALAGVMCYGANARALGMEPIAYYRRYYLENLFFGMNEAFLRRYMEMVDDTIDALLDPPRYGLIFTSPTLIFHGAFGYFYSRPHSLTVVYRKHALRSVA